MSKTRALAIIEEATKNDPGKIKRLIEKLGPREIEALVGGSVGGTAGAGVGYKKGKKGEKGKSTAKGAITGASVGVLSALGLNQLGEVITKGNEAIQKGVNKNVSRGASKIYSDGIARVHKGGFADDEYYDNVYEIKDIINRSMNSIKNRHKSIGARVKTNSVRAKANLNKELAKKRLDIMAKNEANRQTIKNYKDKYIDIKDKVVGDKYKEKAFGGLRGAKESFSNMRGSVINAADFLESTKDLMNELRGANITYRSMGRPSSLDNMSLYRMRHVGVNPNDARKSQKFRDRVKNIRKGAYKDVKFGKKYNFYNDSKKTDDFEKAKSFIGSSKMRELGNMLDIDLSKITTKKELNSQYRKLAKKYHPDINPDGDEMFKKINDAMEQLKASDWYEKLAFNEDFMLEKIAAYIDDIEKVVLRK